MIGRFMSYVHSLLLRRGLLTDILPEKDDLDSDSKAAVAAAKADIAQRLAGEAAVRKEIDEAVRKLQRLNEKNHYGESLRRAFGGV